MVDKDHKLYCPNYSKLKVFDFSREIPHKIFKISVRECIQMASSFYMRFPRTQIVQMAHYKNYMVVTVGGDVLIVKIELPSMSKGKRPIPV